MKEYQLYDGQHLHLFELPSENVVTYKTREASRPVDNVSDLLAKCLKKPLGSPALNKQIKPGMKVVIICDDYTRPTPVYLFLPTLVEELNRLGIPDEDIKLLVSAGHHREMTSAEKERKFGEEAVKRIDIVHHYSEDESNLAFVGRSSTGIDIYLNKLAIESDFKIGIGIVEIHPWAGFSGGGKIVNPGIAAKRTINKTHSLPIKPNVEIGMVESNPFWQTSKESAYMLPLDMLINCILDTEGRVTDIAVGDSKASQLWLIDRFRNSSELLFAESADIVITSACPKYHIWGQTAISLYNSSRIVKSGGVRITLAACPEGLGDCDQEADFYHNALSTRHSSPLDFWHRWLGKDNCHSRNTCAVYKHLKDSEKSDGIIISKNLPKGMVNQPVYEKIEEGLDYAFSKCGKDAKIAVFDKGAMVLASLVK